jgi:hypothetical protein
MSDAKQKRYQANGRATSIRRRQAQDALRLKIDGGRQINRICELLEAKWEKDEVPEKVGKLNGHFKLLGKVLPDLRSIEVTDDRDTAPEEMTDEQLAAKLAEVASLRRKLAERESGTPEVPNGPPGVH